jgi:geranylgeranyl reductase family protein
MSRTVDVLVVGGGPAGSSVAWGLRDSGLTVAVLDKATFPRNKVCAGWITPAVVQALDLDLADYGSSRVLQPIHRFRIGVIGGRDVDIDYGADPVSFGIRRCEFDHYLLERCGAQLWLGEAFRQMTRCNDGWRVNDSIQTRLVVGAGGHFCPVARSLGANLGHSETVVAAQEVEFEMTPRQREKSPVQADTPELYFCTDLKGYGWIFRKGDWLNVGLGREDNHRLAEHVDEFCDWLKERGRLPRDMPMRFSGHAYLLSNRATRPAAASGVLLVGDATGLAYPQSGEGIRPAVESGLLGAQVINEAGGVYSAERLHAYAERLAQRFGSRVAKPTLGSPSRFKQQLARRLLSTRWFSRHFVIDRWFLHRHEPALGY